jgi:hypothetical protein
MAEDPTTLVVEFDDEVGMPTVVDALEAAGGHVRHRYGKLLIVHLSTTAEPAFRRQLPARARLLSSRELEARPAAVGETVEAIGLAAARLRQTQEFRRSKASRPTEGMQWGSTELPEPDAGDDVGDADPKLMTHRPAGGEP